MVLTADAATFTANYYQFVLAVANAISQHTRTILVKSIAYGSANVSLDVSTPFADGSSNATDQQQALQTLFNSGSVAGMSVVSSTVTNNGNANNNNNNNNNNGGSSSSDDDSNTTLIVAIVVPIACVSKPYPMQ